MITENLLQASGKGQEGLSLDAEERELGQPTTQPSHPPPVHQLGHMQRPQVSRCNEQPFSLSGARAACPMPQCEGQQERPCVCGRRQSGQAKPDYMQPEPGGLTVDCLLVVLPCERCGLLTEHTQGVRERRREGRVCASPCRWSRWPWCSPM